MQIPGVSTTIPTLLPTQLDADGFGGSAPQANGGDNWISRSYGDGSGPAIIGHRGVHEDGDGIGDNTLESLQYAHDTGADGIELDIQFLGDGTPVVTHDADGLSDLDASDLACNGGDHDLLSLEEWTQAYRALGDTDLKVFAEFKTESFADLPEWKQDACQPAQLCNPRQEAMNHAVRLLDWSVGSDNLVAASFGADVLASLHKADPELSLGLFAARDGDTSVFDQLDALEDDGVPIDFVEMNEDNLVIEDGDHAITGTEEEREEQTLQRLHDEGYGIVIGRTSEEYITDPRVAGIISNDPANGIDKREQAGLG